jgi:hypothetical protein
MRVMAGSVGNVLSPATQGPESLVQPSAALVGFRIDYICPGWLPWTLSQHRDRATGNAISSKYTQDT